MAHYAVYKKKVKRNIKTLKKSFLSRGLDFQLFYSVKTNYSDPVLATVKETNSEYEILSDFEWKKVEKFKPKALVLNGPGKRFNLAKDILKETKTLYFNIDNDTDFGILKKINKSDIENKLKVGLRVFLNNEGVWNRFGYNFSSKQFLEAVRRLQKITKLSGFHFHFSTNNFKISNYQQLIPKIKNFTDSSEIKLEFLDIGGGLPAANEFLYQEKVYKKLPAIISKSFPQAKIISEAGRNIVADAVDIKAKVISLKKVGEKRFQVSIDTNVMHFPCFFEKKLWVEYIPAGKRIKQATDVEIFGNSCMQVDKITDGLIIEQTPSIGDKVIIHNIGAYSFSQAAAFITEIPEVKAYE